MEIEAPVEITKPKQEIINEVTELKQAAKRVVSEKQLESLAKLRERKKIKAMAKKLNEETKAAEVPKTSILPTVIPSLPTASINPFSTFTITLAAIFSVFILYITSKKKVRIDSQPVQMQQIQPSQQKSTPQNYSALQLGF